MKGRWALALLLFLATCSLSAFAGSPTIGVLDPTCNSSNTSGNGTSSYDYGITDTNVDPVTGAITFNNFAAGPGGGSVVTFCNMTHSVWTDVQFATTNFNSSFAPGKWVFDAGGLDTTKSSTGTPSVVCNVASTDANYPQAFVNCSVTITSNEFLMEFYGTSSTDHIGGVGQNSTLVVNLNTDQTQAFTTDSGDWKSGGNPITFAGGAQLTGPLAPPTVPEPASLLLLGSGVAALVVRGRKKLRR